MTEQRQLLVYVRIFRMLAHMFGAFLLAGLVTALLAPFLGLPAVGWAWMSTWDWDGTTTAEVLMFLVLCLPVLAPLPIAFVGFWKWLAVQTAQQPAAQPQRQYDAIDVAAINARRALGMAPATDVLDGLTQLRARTTALEHAEATLEHRLADIRSQLADIDRLADDTGRRLSRTQTEAMITDLHVRLDDAIRASREVDGDLIARASSATAGRA